jgi:hypothetical protein
MPKAKWGAGDKPLSASDIDGAERQETQKRYSGPMPPAGTYRFIIRSLKQGESSTGNDKVTVMAILDGSWMPNHKTYDGCPVWDHLPIMASTKERVANFLDAIGATGADLMEKAIVDENGYITKLGSVGDPSGLMVYINLQRSKPTKQYPDPSLQVGFNGYIAVDDDASGPLPGEGDEDGVEPPF